MYVAISGCRNIVLLVCFIVNLFVIVLKIINRDKVKKIFFYMNDFHLTHFQVLYHHINCNKHLIYIF